MHHGRLKGCRGLALAAALALLAGAGCGASGGGATNADSGTSDTGGSGGSDGGGGGPSASGLPTPPGAGDLPRPAGTPGNLRVLDWAGFKSAVSYTIDDGQPSQIEHYAELQATGVRMTFFINSASTWEAGFTTTFSQAARDGHEIGNHTANHCHADADGMVYNLDATNQRVACLGASAGAEFDTCTTFITSMLGVSNVWTSASPFGDPGFAASAGERFFLNRGVQGGTVGANDATNPLALPIWGPAENATVDPFNLAVDGARSSGRWLIVLLHSIAPTTNRWYGTVDISSITGSITHAQSMGDVWIDSMMNVGAYWRAQKVVAAVTPAAASGQAQTWTWTLPAHFPTGKFLRVTVDGGTLSQGGQPLTWDGHGYYEIALDAGALTLSP